MKFYDNIAPRHNLLFGFWICRRPAILASDVIECRSHRNGGATWKNLGDISRPNDIDDIFSPTEDSFWTVQNLGCESGGLIFFVKIVNGTPEAGQFNPQRPNEYEGITCVNRKDAIAVGGRTASTDPSEPTGVIVVTRDGGKSRERQEVPVEGVWLWKVSFVGDRF